MYFGKILYPNKKNVHAIDQNSFAHLYILLFSFSDTLLPRNGL